jgi:hypothetical protein
MIGIIWDLTRAPQLILLVENPDGIPTLMRHFRAKSAHMLNSLLARNVGSNSSPFSRRSYE